MGSRSQWPSGLCRSAADCLLGLRVRIPAGHGYFCCVCWTERTKGKSWNNQDKEVGIKCKERKKSAGGMDVCFEYCVLAGRSLCDWPITRPEQSYRRWACPFVLCRNLRNEAALVPVGLWRQRGGRGIGGCSMDVEKNTQCKAPDTSWVLNEIEL
jgi:hypothetical protein